MVFKAISHMANHMVFKVNHMVQGQPWTIPTPEYTHMDFKVTIIYGQPYGFQGQSFFFSISTTRFKVINCPQVALSY